MKVDYSLILKGIEFVIDHKDEITTAVKEGKDLVDWLREKFGGHEGLTDIERALLHKAIDDLASIPNESQAPPLTPPPVAPPIDPTSVEYDSSSDAIAATTPTNPFVILKANGKYVIYPVASPFPGTKVWPVD